MLAEQVVGAAARDVGLGVFGVELHRLLAILERFGVLLQAHVDGGASHVEARVFRVPLQGFGVIGDGAVVVIEALPHGAADAPGAQILAGSG